MNEIQVDFNMLDKNEELSIINIKVTEEPMDKLLYKFICGKDGVWDTIKEYSNEKSVDWKPKSNGKYTVMVQGKKENSDKPFDFVTRAEYIAGTGLGKLIKLVNVSSSNIKVGEKLTIIAESVLENCLFRFSVKAGDNWHVIKDYSAENQLVITIKESGKLQFLVEAKEISSTSLSDEFQVVDVEAIPIDKLEIKNFRTLNSSLICDDELIFEVNCEHEDERMVLYKFIKIDESGISTVIQDYSNKKIVSYIENKEGKYKLLCLAKDMYSPKEYDDRALLCFKVKPYLPIEIQSLITDVSSPQFEKTNILVKTIAIGGKNLQYRYIIDGQTNYDSGYGRSNTLNWQEHMPGEYKITVYVKDASSREKFEDKKELSYIIEEGEKKALKITNVIVDKDFPVIVGEKINFKVIAEGGIEPVYSFIVRKGNDELETINYGECNFVNFTPECEGNYELEVRAKGKYSTRLYDSHNIIYFKVLKFLPSTIEHILIPSNSNFFVGDSIKLNIITSKAKETLIKYVIKIDGHFVEESSYSNEKAVQLIPKCSGRYSIDIYAKNKKSDSEYDSKKSVKIDVRDAYPIVNTKIIPDKGQFLLNEGITFSIEFQGGKEVISEFYIQERGEWNLAQKYSKKHFYSFIPFSKGKYKVLALAKSSYIKKTYEDYNIFEFEVV